MKLEFPRYDSYKQSGIAWINVMPSHWTAERAKWLFRKMDRPVRPEDDIVTAFRDGQVTLRKNRRTEGFTNALQEHGYQGIRRGDLVIHAMDAFAGAIGVSDSDGKATPVYSVCVPHGTYPVHPHYFAYLLRYMALSGYIQSLAKGIRERSTDFRFNDFANLVLPIPTITEQTRIAAFLDDKTAEIDAAIAKQQRLIELLLEQKAILINRAVTRGIDPNAPLRDSGIAWIGEMPAHWQVSRSKWLFAHRKERSRLGDQQLTASQEFGVIPQQEYMEKTGYRVMQVTLNTEILKHVEVDDFVISMRSFQGGLERAKASGCISSAYVVLESSPQANIDYFTYLFKSVRYIEALQSTSNLVRDGQALRYDNFCMVPLPVIPIKEQEAIAAFLDQATSQIDTLREKIQKEIELLKEFRTILISQAVTGKIKV